MGGLLREAGEAPASPPALFTTLPPTPCMFVPLLDRGVLLVNGGRLELIWITAAAGGIYRELFS